MTGSKPDIFHTPLLTPFASRLIHICVDLREIRTSDAHPKIPQNPCGRRDTEACTHLRGQPQNPREGRAACTKQKEPVCPRPDGRGLFPWGLGRFLGPPQNRRFCGERRSGGVSKPRRMRRGAGYGARDDAAPPHPLPLPPTWAACTKQVLSIPRRPMACGEFFDQTARPGAPLWGAGPCSVI